MNQLSVAITYHDSFAVSTKWILQQRPVTLDQKILRDWHQETIIEY